MSEPSLLHVAVHPPILMGEQDIPGSITPAPRRLPARQCAARAATCDGCIGAVCQE